MVRLTQVNCIFISPYLLVFVDLYCQSSGLLLHGSQCICGLEDSGLRYTRKESVKEVLPKIVQHDRDNQYI